MNSFPPTQDVELDAHEARRKKNEIFSRYHTVTPGSAAEEEMVHQYLPLVKSVVGRMAMSLPSHIDSEELYSSGLVGLLNAIRNFDPQGGSSFESYARVRIRGSIIDELRRLDWVPRSIHDKARHVEETMQKLEQQKGRLPSDAEVAEALNLSAEEYDQLLQEIKPATFVCLDSTQADSENGASHYECIADDSQEDPVELAARRELAGMISKRIEQLPEMQKKVLALYYYEDMRLREIAAVFGVTESRICQIHSQAILAIKSFLSKQVA